MLRKEGKDITSSKEKAEVLNQQYAFVFTKENANSPQNNGNYQFPMISSLEIESQGITKLILIWIERKQMVLISYQQ